LTSIIDHIDSIIEEDASLLLTEHDKPKELASIE